MHRTSARRKASVRTLLALMAGTVIAIAACDSDNHASLTVGSGGGSGRTGSISNNHGHVAAITSAELAAGNALTLDIRGTADHTHTVPLGAAEVDQIRLGQRVTASSSLESSPTFGPHSHTVTFN